MTEPHRINERYRLEKRVSSKGSGSVFRAVDTHSGSTVAVKLINIGDSAEHRASFAAHVAALREVQHPALPRILDCGFTTAGSAFLVTEHIPGDDLGDLVDAPPARVLTFLLQLVDGLEALASRGLTVGNLSIENLRITTGPDGEQVKILGLGGAAFHGKEAEGSGADGSRADLRAFAHLAIQALGLPFQDSAGFNPGDETIALPLEVASALAEPERLRELLASVLHGGRQLPNWQEVRRALRTALFGETGSPPPVSWDGDATMAVEKLGPAPTPGPDAPRRNPRIVRVETLPGTPPSELNPAPPAVPDLTTRVFRPEELATTPAATPAPVPPPPPAAPTVRLEVPGRARADASRQGAVRIPLKDLEEAPVAQPLRFPTPVPTPEPPSRPASDMDDTRPQAGATIPFPAPQAPPPPPLPAAAPAPSPAPQPLPPPVPSAAALRTAPPVASARRSAAKELRLALLIGVPLVLLLAAGVGLVAWMSRRSAQPETAPQSQTTPPQPAQRPAAPPLTPRSIHPQILLAEESLNAGDLAAARSALDAILPEDIALFTAEEQDRYQRARDALTPLQSQQWAETLTRGLSTGDLRLLRAAAASPPAAATLTPEQKRDLARARKILDLDSQMAKAQRAEDHAETLRQAGLLLAELPRSSRATRARNQAADALLAEADARAAQGQLDAALAALEQLREGWSDHPGIAERLERLRAMRRAEEQMEDALAAATRAEKSERPLDGLQILDRVRPSERYAERFRQARERLQAQFAQLDRNPPQIAMTGPSELSYKEEETVTIPLRITDDQGVTSTEAWARPEGGRFTKISVRHVGGADYVLDIGPALHQRKSIDFYITATDQSGHEGALGSVQRPQKIKRKGWLSKVLGGKEGG